MRAGGLFYELRYMDMCRKYINGLRRNRLEEEEARTDSGDWYGRRGWKTSRKKKFSVCAAGQYGKIIMKMMIS